MGISNAYGAGIFFSAGVMHLLHEADEMIDSVCDGGHCGFPFASLIAVSSYMLLLCMMKVIYSKHCDLEHSIHNIELVLSEIDTNGRENNENVNIIDPSKNNNADQGELTGAIMLLCAMGLHSVIINLVDLWDCFRASKNDPKCYSHSNWDFIT